MKNRVVFAGLVLSATVAVACSSSTETEPAPAPVTPPAPTATATTPMKPVPPPPKPLDHGAVSTTYPAFTPTTGQILSNGGPILTNPVIVTVTWPSDPRVAQFEAFGDAIGASTYWKDINSEYGAAAAVSGAANHLHLPDAAPASISDTQLATLVQTSLAAAGTTWPIPATGNPVYILYLPTTTMLLIGGAESCGQNIGGYHDSVMVNGNPVAYAIIPYCGGAVEDTTITASHELDEATTDPYPNSHSAFRGFRDEDVAWEVFLDQQDEVGDACEFFDDSVLSPGDSSAALTTFSVQRQWSNKSGLSGHDPCVPEFTSEVYFSVAPLDTEDISVFIKSSIVVTKGYLVKQGQTRQIPLGFYSADTTSPWTIKVTSTAADGSALSSDAISLALDVTTGQNGQKAYLSITVKTPSPTLGEILTVESSKGNVKHYVPFMIGN